MSTQTLLQHADIWRGDETPSAVGQSVPTGHADLDNLFPGGGWPVGALTEIFSDQQGTGALSLVMPALAELSQQTDRWLAWIAPPHVPYAPALAAMGVDLSRVLWVHPRSNSDSLWALEQALRSGTCAAVLGWPGSLDARILRRLQLAAEAGGALGLLFNDSATRTQTSPAALRLHLNALESGVEVHILKRRGGWSAGPVQVSL